MLRISPVSATFQPPKNIRCRLNNLKADNDTTLQVERTGFFPAPTLSVNSLFRIWLPFALDAPDIIWWPILKVGAGQKTKNEKVTTFFTARIDSVCRCFIGH
jgi:hypothetical protein